MSYDTIWETFKSISGYNDSDLPQDESVIYSTIHSGIYLYNQKQKKYPNRLLNKITYNDAIECIDIDLDEQCLLILCYLIASVVANNELNEFTSVWGVFAKEAGISNIKSQTDAKTEKRRFFEGKAEKIIEDLIDSFEL